MPTLETYNSQQQLQTPRRINPGDVARSVAGVAEDLYDFNEEIKELDFKNQKDQAEISYRSDLAKLSAGFDPSKQTEEDYNNSVGELRQQYRDSIEDPRWQGKFDLDTELPTTSGFITVSAKNKQHVIDTAKNTGYAKLGATSNLAPQERNVAINTITNGMLNERLIDQPTADKLKRQFRQDGVLADASRSLADAKAVRATLKDPNQKVYDLEADQLNPLLGSVENTIKRLTIDDGWADLTNQEKFAAKSEEVMADSKAGFEAQSRAIYNIGTMMGIGSEKIKAQQARLQFKYNTNETPITPSISNDAYNTYSVELENLSLSKPESFDEAIEFIQRYRELRDRLDADSATGILSYTDSSELNTKYGKALADAESLAMGEIGEEDDDSFLPAWAGGDKNPYSFEKSAEYFDNNITNPQIRTEAFRSYIRTVERMENTGWTPTFVNKDADKWQKRREVRNYIKLRYDAEKPVRAREILDAAKRMRRWSDKQDAWMIHDGKGWIKE